MHFAMGPSLECSYFQVCGRGIIDYALEDLVLSHTHSQTFVRAYVMRGRQHDGRNRIRHEAAEHDFVCTFGFAAFQK